MLKSDTLSKQELKVFTKLWMKSVCLKIGVYGNMYIFAIHSIYLARLVEHADCPIYDAL